jgi:polyphosphate kinase 2 (PPK2 family)
MNLKTRLAKLEVLNNFTANNQVIFIGFGASGDDTKLLGYTHTLRGKEIRVMRLADESVDDFMRRCEDTLPAGAGVVILFGIYSKT